MDKFFYLENTKIDASFLRNILINNNETILYSEGESDYYSNLSARKYNVDDIIDYFSNNINIENIDIINSILNLNFSHILAIFFLKVMLVGEIDDEKINEIILEDNYENRTSLILEELNKIIDEDSLLSGRLISQIKEISNFHNSLEIASLKNSKTKEKVIEYQKTKDLKLDTLKFNFDSYYYAKKNLSDMENVAELEDMDNDNFTSPVNLFFSPTSKSLRYRTNFEAISQIFQGEPIQDAINNTEALQGEINGPVAFLWLILLYGKYGIHESFLFHKTNFLSDAYSNALISIAKNNFKNRLISTEVNATKALKNTEFKKIFEYWMNISIGDSRFFLSDKINELSDVYNVYSEFGTEESTNYKMPLINQNDNYKLLISKLSDDSIAGKENINNSKEIQEALYMSIEPFLKNAYEDTNFITNNTYSNYSFNGKLENMISALEENDSAR